ncbi:hypothetical protein GOHSU_04_00770 [Gordonia hirsuta DSM 44140 = NBRC 16056]|uniref:Bifunctional glucose-6-phosphate/mannose-6-phosphate isomerase C-terminal domain-containing protein n=1 Tax=Gordonia hirsuta DSM 44140 = NBRC 16056 TaxID=1121927 RepID=L7L856_9ACTN|nr:hypothetical protein [Gordonia hirsuta]GAC56208.1 hypothetical protein GOHSU_04_00770 [Gordonia hirsuta DSM 44140 = NBRC 16056]
MPVTIDDLDDSAALSAADQDGLLRSAAMAGAQIRAVAEAQREGVLDALATARPRAVVVVTGSDLLADRAARLAIAVCAADLDVPIVPVPVLPGWIGPLDVVLIAGGDAGDPLLADALSRAALRRCEIVVSAPLEGPLREAAGIGERGGVPLLDLSPRLPVDPRFRFTGLVAAVIAVLTALSSVRLRPSPPGLAELADLLDAEAAADHPGQESFHNQAKLLALRTADHRPVWTGDTPAARVAAAQAAAAFFEIAGLGGAVTEESRAIAALQQSSAAGGVDPLFYDPEFDGPAPADPVRVFLVSTAARSPQVHRRLGDRDVDVLTEQVDAAEQLPALPADAREAFGDTPTDLAAYLIIVVRAQLAAAYCALSGDREMM